nr:immunoglobulin heavy chain junction region [Macaca mulatta]MOW32362.1 immunoglobulin heavy chain junction region [Macaca mulatta]MOW32457.1 immunoglobulin heavy chain junction region [Macaca mulatta]MOW32488.1 immunoglobulin heavy chain junction region [Macaca mulatta]MOW32728.1 immunoglobulin heavy chain junction region [Macaca mulatta]
CARYGVVSATQTFIPFDSW